MNKAFSLVELSIVLVILGLLTGGVLTGQSLIRAAELRSVVTEFKTYQTAVMTFRDKYFALPGDMRNATDFWGAMTNCGVASPSGTGTQTCNGDGDGEVDRALAASQTGEMFNFWQQLSNAGLIEGSYTGITGSGSDLHAIFGENAPTSKMSSSMWAIQYLEPDWSGNGNNFKLGLGNHYIFGGSSASSVPVTPILTPEEAWNIDTKVDDGKPAYGKVIAMYWNDQCSSADNGSHALDNYEASYKLSDSSVQCAIRFRNAF